MSQLRPLEAWHLLSLDAPTVATLWTWFVARAFNASLPQGNLLATFLAVWILYAVDRLLDAHARSRNVYTPSSLLVARHRFHHHHRTAFLTCILVAALTLLPLVLSLPRIETLAYLFLGALLLAWFTLIHLVFPHRPDRLPKELAVGPFFAAAVFIPTLSAAPSLRLALLTPAVIFALLCSLNCLFIFSWEHDPSTAPAHLTTRLALRALQPLAAVGVLAPILFLSSRLILNRTVQPPSLFLALSLAFVLQLLLDRTRRRFNAIDLRAAADLVLLTPLLLLPFLQ